MILADLEMTDGGWRFMYFAAMIIPAMMLATVRSTFLVDFYFLVVCSNRFVRRFLDWLSNDYDPRPISSLLPLLIGGLMFLSAFRLIGDLPSHQRRAFYFAIAALAYSAIIGFGNRIMMIYSLLEYVAPLGLLFYVITIRAPERCLIRWFNLLSALGISMAIYAWVQWVQMPAWDAAWLNRSGMWTSMGRPEPYKNSVCSTLESRGPYAWFMAMLVIPGLLSPSCRQLFSWLAPVMCAVAILPSTVRSAWGIVFAGVVVYFLLSGVKELPRLALGISILAVAMTFLRARVSEAEMVFDRVGTIANMTEDASFQGRAEMGRYGLGMVLTNPVGFGMGSSGLTSKLGGDSSQVVDNGFLEVLATFGLPGFALLVGCYYNLYGDVFRFARETGDEVAILACTMFFAGMVATLFSNWFALACSGIAMLPLGIVIARLNEDAAYDTEFVNDDL